MTGGTQEPGIQTGINKLQRAAFGLIAVGLIGTLIGAATMQGEFLRSYLFAFVFWMCMTIGFFGFTLLHHVVRASWGKPILRLLEAGGGPYSFGLMALLFVPITLFGKSLYPWAAPQEVPPLFAFKAGFLSWTFTNICTYIFYFGAWAGIAWLLRQSSLSQDRTGDRAQAQFRSNLAAPAIVYFFLSVTFAFTHWVMALDKYWFSTIYGVWFVVGSGLLTLATIILLVIRWGHHMPYREEVTPQTRRDLSNLTLAFTMLWAYISLSQFLIIWSGNLPEEVTYYITRMSGAWSPLGTILIFGQFFIPFLCLLAPRTKRVATILRNVAIWILLMRLLDVFWIVMPALRPNAPNNGVYVQWTDVAAFALIGGLWLCTFVWQLKSAPLIPNHAYPAPREQEKLSHA